MTQHNSPTSRPIRTLIVDDLSLTRRDLNDALAAESDIEIVGTASTVRAALSRIEELNPDVVVTKLDLPDRGLALLRSLVQAGNFIPVVVFDVELEVGSPRSLDARQAGAVACVTRPKDRGTLLRTVQADLAPALRKSLQPFSSRRSKLLQSSDLPAPIAETRRGELEPVPTKRTCESAAVVAIATSTGGPDALGVLLAALPSDFTIPIVIVQHMPSGFTSTLAERLSTLTGRRVAEGRDGVSLDEADIWIAPGGRHLLLERIKTDIVLRLSDAEPENSCRPSADVLFRSVAEIFGSRSLGVVLTGMGQDGLAGSRIISERGGDILVQDQTSSVVWSMPRAVAEAGLASAVLPLREIAAEIQRRCRRGRA